MRSGGQQMKHTDERLTRMLPWRNFVRRQEIEKRERLVVFVFLVKKKKATAPLCETHDPNDDDDDDDDDGQREKVAAFSLLL